jgi:geranylgeranyl diphosphate synthase type II
MTFEQELNIKRADIEDIVKTFIPRKLSVTDEAVAYSIKAGGKRLRPLFLICFYEAFKKGRYADKSPDFVEIMDGLAGCFAGALELIHTYSLVHDDLPDMDNDMLRRGKPTTHAKFGPAMGILAGDALLNEAFSIIADVMQVSAAYKDKEPIMRAVKCFKMLADNAGREGMILGQEIDLNSEGKSIDNETLLLMYELKTSKLLESAFCIGAGLGGASDKELKICNEAAKNLGIAFQIRDDILDVTGDEKKLGKPVGSDSKNDKRTYVYIQGLEKARKDAVRYTDEAVSLVRSLGLDTSFIEKLMLKLLERES